MESRSERRTGLSCRDSWYSYSARIRRPPSGVDLPQQSVVYTSREHWFDADESTIHVSVMKITFGFISMTALWRNWTLLTMSSFSGSFIPNLEGFKGSNSRVFGGLKLIIIKHRSLRSFLASPRKTVACSGRTLAWGATELKFPFWPKIFSAINWPKYTK